MERNALNEKISKLENMLRDKSVIIAFSGGVDSTVLTYIARKVASRVLAVTEENEFYDPDEITEAIKIAKELNVPHKVIKVPIDNDAELLKNPLNRCYLCKSGLFNSLKKIAEKEKFDLIVDGSNFDDKSDYRPGLKALKELNIRSPLAEVGLTKQEIREYARLKNISVADKPSNPCLASRIPFGEEITKEKLKMVMLGERFLKNKLGFKVVRVRFHKNRLARIELGKNNMKQFLENKNAYIKRIITRFKEIGFKYVTLDLEGYRSGSLNP
ncbi:MAG: ATP-dependent sacrificial sulfur transferase LarE [Candidatus Odinarchaeia archaeon]